jgi:hypothetical protein
MNEWSYSSTPPLYLHGIDREKMYFVGNARENLLREFDFSTIGPLYHLLYVKLKQKFMNFKVIRRTKQLGL